MSESTEYFSWVFYPPNRYLLLTAAFLLLSLLIGTTYVYRKRNLRRLIYYIATKTLLFATLIFLLFRPTLLLQEWGQVSGKTAILLDRSASMSLPSNLSGKWKNSTRYDVAKEAYNQLVSGSATHATKLFTFAELPQLTTPQSLATTSPDIPATHLLPALDTARPNDLITKIVLLSDGRFDDVVSSDNPKFREFLDRYDGTIDVVRVSDSSQLTDISIDSVAYDRFAYVHNKTSISATILAKRLPTPSDRSPNKTLVKLFRDGEEIAQRTLFFDPQRDRYQLDFDYIPETLGNHIYTLVAIPLGEEASFSNNIKEFEQETLRDKIRILHVAGPPSWDSRFLNQVFRSNPNVELITFHILRTAENVDPTPESEQSLIEFPERELFEEELGSFDLVVLQNYRISPYRISYYGDKMVDYVNNGGALAIIGGSKSFHDGQYNATKMASLLPVEVKPPSSTKTVDFSSYSPILTSAGITHPVTKIAFNPDTNRQYWNSLPPLHGTNLVGSLTEGSLSLLTHPTLTVRGGEPLSILAIRDVGKGRTLSLTTDSSWRWGLPAVESSVDPTGYSTFWWNAVRWLVHDPALNLLHARFQHDDNIPLSLVIHATDAEFKEAKNVELEVNLAYRPPPRFISYSLDFPPSTAITPQPILLTTDSSGVARYTIPNPQRGLYRATISAKNLPGSESLTIESLYPPSNTNQYSEYDAIEPDNALLESIAVASGGKLYYVEKLSDYNILEDIRERKMSLNRVEEIPLTTNVVVLLLLVGLFGAVWWQGRRL